MSVQVDVLGPGIGAEVLGADVRTMTDADFGVVYRAWLDHNVVCVRDQSLTMDEFLAWSRRFGRLHRHPSKMTRHPDHPELTVMGVDKFRPDGSLNMAVYARGGATWHTDGAYDRVPYKATQLYALAIPSRGGDTLFASMYRAWDRLPPDLRARIEGRLGAFTYGGRTGTSSALLDEEDRAHPPALHPLCRVHPETGRKGLYFDPGKIVRIEGLDPEESEALIEELTRRMVDDAGVYRHRWRVGDVVIWDNRCSYHLAAADYPPEEDRIHWRVSIKEPGTSADGTELGA